MSLRERRERHGLSLKEAASATGVPADLLAALEREEGAELAPGGIADRARERYLRFLDELDARGVEPTASTGIQGRPRVPVLRLLGVALALVVIAGLSLHLLGLLLDRGSPGSGVLEAPPPPEEHAPIELQVRAISPVRLDIDFDGDQRFTGVLPGRSSRTFTAHHRLSVTISDLSRVELRWNGRRLQPLGNLSSPRTLVFLAD